MDIALNEDGMLSYNARSVHLNTSSLLSNVYRHDLSHTRDGDCKSAGAVSLLIKAKLLLKG